MYNGAAFPPAGQDGASFIGPSSASSSALNLNIVNSTTVSFDRYGVSADNFTLPTLSAGQWYHIAFVRNASNATTVFLNGIRSSTGTVTSSYNYSGTTNAVGFTGGAVSRYFPGYISNARLVVGSAVYDPTQTSITVPNGPLQAIANTTLLTCAYSTFRDGSTNNFTITVNGNTAVSTQNPFPLTTLPNPAQGNAGNGIFSMSQYQSLKQQNLWPAIDPYFRNTTLLLHGNGTNGAQNNTFLDSSTNNFTITRNGNTTQGTFTPYGSNWSNYFNGTDAYLITGTSSNLTLANNADWTVEAWIFLSASTYQQILFNSGGGSDSWSTQHNCDFAVNSSGFLSFEYSASGTSTSVAGTTATTRNAWNHIAWVFNGTSKTLTTYVNGVRDLNATSVSGYTPPNATPRITIGRTDPTVPNPYQWWVTGYISNVRVVRGSQVYSGATITVPTGPLTAITNTSLLTCQSNRFIDNSSNAFAITVNGSPSVQRFSPFNPSAPYAAGTIGGSGYFDGSGDYLSVADNAAFDFGSGDFTIECWAYTDTFASQYNVLVCQWNTSYSFIFRITSSLVGLYINVGNPYTLQDYSASVTNTTGQWNHFCVTRSGSTLTFYKNGASIGTSSISATITNAASDLTVGVLGDLNSTTYHKGYISGMRLIKGTAVAPTITTPPTAVSGTSLLLNFTNGGIIDNAMMNDLETVGNAQISTTQSKFGGASMYFDGNGDYLTAATTPAQQYGTGNFTIEFWFYKTANGSYNYGDSTGDFFLRIGNTGFTVNSVVISTNNSQQITAFIGYNGSSWATTIVSSSTFSLDTWYHVALVRAGTGSNQTTLYVNGTSYGTGTSSTDLTDASFGTALRIGASSSDRYYNGYIDDLRITKGIARYTSNFTPQTSQWQDQ